MDIYRYLLILTKPIKKRISTANILFFDPNISGKNYHETPNVKFLRY
jgi:hypothetical protein